MRGFFQNIGKLFEYLLAILFVGIFALYCSGRVGWFLMLTLLLAPILSMVYAGISVRFLEVTGEINGEIYSKGDHLLIRLNIANRGYFPSSFLQVQLLENDHWKTDDQQIFTALSPRSEEQISVSYQAQYAGGSEIGIKGIYVCDFLGLLSIPLKVEPGELNWKVGIIPDMEQEAKAEEFFHEVLQKMGGYNESEATLDVSTDTFGGFPGYEYREYRPGDPMKRINYKLSAKKDELWVRLDEKQAVANIHLMLDPYYTMESYGAIDVQHFLEVGLGLVQNLLLREFVIEVWIGAESEEKIEHYEIREEAHLISLAKAFSKYQFARVRKPMVLPDVVEQAEATVLYVTPNSDGELLQEVELMKKNRAINIHIYSTNEGGDKAC